MKTVTITRADSSTSTARLLVDAQSIAPGYGVYELFSEEGSLLYVGRTKNLVGRLQNHRSRKPWFAQVAYVGWTPCDDYAELVALERMAISTNPGSMNEFGQIDLDEHRSRMELPSVVAARLRDLYAHSEVTTGGAHLTSYVRALRDAGWTLQSIATPLNITRERIRQWAELAAVDYDLLVPGPPSTKRPKVRPAIWPWQADLMRGLQGSATQLRGVHGPAHPFRVASEALTETIVEARMRGVTNRAIADVIGVSDRTVVQRLKTHGFATVAPSQTAFGTPHPRVFGTRQDVCHDGHPLAGDNLRLVNGDPGRRACRACTRRRSAEYKARQRTA